jgi:hypothetical protein
LEAHFAVRMAGIRLEAMSRAGPELSVVNLLSIAAHLWAYASASHGIQPPGFGQIESTSGLLSHELVVKNCTGERREILHFVAGRGVRNHAKLAA